MSDLEMTRLCAEAMGFEWSRPKSQPHSQTWVTTDDSDKWKLYDPLNDDAQAMVLVKQFTVRIEYRMPASMWIVWERHKKLAEYKTESRDLNRAIVTCVASMQRAKAAA